MSSHILDRLGAYMDGELRAEGALSVAAHLADCADCRRALGELRSLRQLLQDSYPALAPTPAARFVARVAQRLPAAPEPAAWRRALVVAWRMIPLGLLGCLVFGQVVLGVSGAALLLFALVPETATAVGLATSSPSVGWIELSLASLVGEVGAALLAVADAWRWVSAVGGLAALELLLLTGVTLLYWSWLASWWARRRSRALAMVNR